jgi:hypothetical protein
LNFLAKLIDVQLQLHKERKKEPRMDTNEREYDPNRRWTSRRPAGATQARDYGGQAADLRRWDATGKRSTF